MTTYVCARHTMGIAANRQRVYHDENTATRFCKPGDWVLYRNKPESLQTLSCGWTGPYVVVVKVSHVHYTIQFVHDGKKRTIAIKTDPIGLRTNSLVD